MFYNPLHKYLAICFVLSKLFSFTFCQDTMSALVQDLKTKGIIKSDLVANTMLSVDRKIFCANCTSPYADKPQSLGYGATISAPHMHAMALELMKDHLVEGYRALDIGSGSGYLTVCMATMLRNPGICTGIDHISELTAEAIKNTEKAHKSLITSRRIKFVTDDGRLGMPRGSPYDVIHCGATFRQYPSNIINQLKLGGRFVGPIASPNEEEYLTVIDKHLNGTITEKKIVQVVYIPMQDKEIQIETTTEPIPKNVTKLKKGQKLKRGPKTTKKP